MLAAALSSQHITSQPTEVSRRRLSLRHVKVVPSHESLRESTNQSSNQSSHKPSPREAANAALRVDTVAVPLNAPQRGMVRETPTPAMLTTEMLFKGKSSIEIMHAGEAYKLTITSNGKLILTK